MYILKPGVKQDPQRRWQLPDRIFFAHGACHILAGVFLQRFPDALFKAIWVKPIEGYYGSHIFVTNGSIAFDYHGYSKLERLILHHESGWSRRFPGWSADIVAVNFSLLNTAELNVRNMKGPDEYLGDAIQRSNQYLDRIDHARALEKVTKILEQ